MNKEKSKEVAPTTSVESKKNVNELTADEKKAGWELLFNGKDMSSWRNFKKESIGTSWILDDDAIHNCWFWILLETRAIRFLVTLPPF